MCAEPPSGLPGRPVWRQRPGRGKSLVSSGSGQAEGPVSYHRGDESLVHSYVRAMDKGLQGSKGPILPSLQAALNCIVPLP